MINSLTDLLILLVMIPSFIIGIGIVIIILKGMWND